MAKKLRLWQIVAGVILAASAASYAQRYTPTKAPPASQEAAAKPADPGKALFVEKCGSCHGENGDKALSSGAPLSQRKLSQETVLKAVRGRLKGRTETEQRAVAGYILGFQSKPAR